jgi:hypothetical protein
VAAVNGWCSIEDLTRLAFSQAQVVMANEAHSGLARCVRTRDVGVRIIRAAHEAGVRRLAMEVLPHPAEGELGPVRDIPVTADADPAELLSLDFTNRREQEQADNLCRILAEAPARPLLVWSGNSHAAKKANGAWVPMDIVSRSSRPPTRSSSTRR